MTPHLLLGLLTGTAAIFDVLYRRIPNWLVLAGLVAGFSSNGFGRAAAGMGVGLALYLPLYLLKARGAGDVKLLAAAGSIVGAGDCLWLFIWTAIAGGVIALVLVLLKGRTRQTLFNVGWIVRDLVHLRAPHRSSAELDVSTDKGLRLPHGVAVAAGALVLILVSRAR